MNIQIKKDRNIQIKKDRKREVCFCEDRHQIFEELNNSATFS